MKFDCIDWKILPFEVGKKRFFEPWLASSNDFDHHLCIAYFELKKFVLKN